MIDAISWIVWHRGSVIAERTNSSLICPLAELCQAQQTGNQNALPVRAARPNRPHHDVTAAVIRDGNDRFLIAQRPLESMLGGLWEFPGGKRLPGEELRDCLRREIEEEVGVEIEVGELLCAIDHAFTHFHMTLYAFGCRLVRGTPRCLGCLALRWVALDETDAFAFPVADQKILAFLRNQQPVSGHSAGSIIPILGHPAKSPGKVDRGDR